MDKSRLYAAWGNWPNAADPWRIPDAETRLAVGRLALATELILHALEHLIDQVDDQLDEGRWETRDRLARLEHRIMNRIAGRDEDEE